MIVYSETRGHPVDGDVYELFNARHVLLIPTDTSDEPAHEAEFDGIIERSNVVEVPVRAIRFDARVPWSKKRREFYLDLVPGDDSGEDELLKKVHHYCFPDDRVLLVRISVWRFDLDDDEDENLWRWRVEPVTPFDAALKLAENDIP